MPTSRLDSLTAGLDTVEVGGWLLPARYQELPDEVAAVRGSAGLIDLANVGVITIQAEEVVRWAHGMFTNHIKRLQPGQGNRSAMCDDRGRVGGLIDTYSLAPDMLLGVLEGVDHDWFAERYKMFLILEDIELEDLCEDHHLLGLAGPGAGAVAAAAGLPVPAGDHDHLEAEGVRVFRKDRTGLGGLDILVPAAEAPALWQRLLEAGASPMGHQTLDALRVLAGKARWPVDGTEKSLVHELRINEEVCNFQKGCYLGQEVINRIDVKGQVQKMLTGLSLPRSVQGAQEITVSHGGKAVGTLTSALDLGSRHLALGVLRKAVWEPGTEVVVEVDGEAFPATVMPLPFG